MRNSRREHGFFLRQLAARACGGLLALLLLGTGVPYARAGDEALFDAGGYRTSQYMAPVDRIPDGVTRLDLDTLQKLIADVKPLLIDVLPANGARVEPASGAWADLPVHRDIPGSHWLPNVGRGKIEAWQQAYFTARLAALSKGDKAAPMVIYCQSDCWMAYNALKRAQELGYSRLYWFPEGSDGWRDFDSELVAVTPDPVDPAIAKDAK